MQRWSRSPSEASFIKDSRKINHKKGLSLSWIGCLIGCKCLASDYEFIYLVEEGDAFLCLICFSELEQAAPMWSTSYVRQELLDLSKMTTR